MKLDEKEPPLGKAKEFKAFKLNKAQGDIQKILKKVYEDGFDSGCIVGFSSGIAMPEIVAEKEALKKKK